MNFPSHKQMAKVPANTMLAKMCKRVKTKWSPTELALKKMVANANTLCTARNTSLGYICTIWRTGSGT